MSLRKTLGHLICRSDVGYETRTSANDVYECLRPFTRPTSIRIYDGSVAECDKRRGVIISARSMTRPSEILSPALTLRLIAVLVVYSNLYVLRVYDSVIASCDIVWNIVSGGAAEGHAGNDDDSEPTRRAWWLRLFTCSFSIVPPWLGLKIHVTETRRTYNTSPRTRSARRTFGPVWTITFRPGRSIKTDNERNACRSWKPAKTGLFWKFVTYTVCPPHRITQRPPCALFMRAKNKITCR